MSGKDGCPIGIRQQVAASSMKYNELEVLSGLSEEYSRSRNTIRAWLRDLEKRGFKVVRPYHPGRKKSAPQQVLELSESQEEAKKLPQKELFELALREYFDFIGRRQSRKTPKLPKPKFSNKRTIVVMCDTHGKPHVPGLIKALDLRPDLALFVGDCLDAFAYSRFDRIKSIPIQEEMANLRAAAEMVSGVCRSRWATGNHDDRVWKWFSRHVPLEYMPLITTDILSATLIGIENAEVVSDTHSYTTAGGVTYEDVLETSFLMWEGDACFGHAEMARKGELNTVRGFRDWYNRWKNPLGWTEPVLLGEAHVHRAGIGYPNGGHSIDIELGCMLNPSQIAYAVAGGDTRWSPPAIGYTVVEQYREKNTDGWKTDIQSVQFVPC